jgi:hypothetical protein
MARIGWMAKVRTIFQRKGERHTQPNIKLTPFQGAVRRFLRGAHSITPEQFRSMLLLYNEVFQLRDTATVDEIAFAIARHKLTRGTINETQAKSFANWIQKARKLKGGDLIARTEIIDQLGKNSHY